MSDTPRGRPSSVLTELAHNDPAKVKSVMEALLNEYGQNRTKAADAMGVSRTTFYTVAASVGLQLARPRNDLGLTRAGLLALLVAARGNRNAVAGQLGVSKSTVHRLIKQYKLGEKCPASTHPYWKSLGGR